MNAVINIRASLIFCYSPTPTLPFFFFFLMIRRPPSSPLFPYTPLSRSQRTGPAGRPRLERDPGVARDVERRPRRRDDRHDGRPAQLRAGQQGDQHAGPDPRGDRKSTRLNSSHLVISYAVFCLKKKQKKV